MRGLCDLVEVLRGKVSHNFCWETAAQGQDDARRNRDIGVSLSGP